MCRFSIKFVELTRTVNSCVQVLTGAQRRVKTEAVATCVCLHLRSINTPLNTPVCVRRDRSWLLTAYAADLVSQNTTVVKQIYTFYFWNFIEPKAEKWTQDINWHWHVSIIIWMPYFQPILEHQQHPPPSQIYLQFAMYNHLWSRKLPFDLRAGMACKLLLWWLWWPQSLWRCHTEWNPAWL